MATCVDLAGAEYPQKYKDKEIIPLEGVSLVPALEGNSLDREDPIFWEHEGNRAVRIGKWKLVSRVKRNMRFTEADKDQWELYDLEADRTEMNDLSAQYPQKVKEMSAQWEAWAERAKVIPWPWEEGK
jgi:arylsulfatase